MQPLTPKEWVENWKRVGSILEEIKAKELQSMDERDAMRKLMSMCDWCIKHSEPRLTSGLVEQQRLFAKLRKKTINNDAQ